MEPMTNLDIFVTKGIEYLLVIGYLLLLIPVWLQLRKTWLATKRAEVAVAPAKPRNSWFRVPAELFFHPGHGWAQADAEGIYSVGIDEFAERLLGAPSEILLPELGTELRQGEPGWSLSIAGTPIEILAPVGGEVVAVNEELQHHPALLAEDPYGAGWLMKIRAPRSGAAERTLLAGEPAAAWMDQQVDMLRRQMGSEAGAVLQDGGEPISGIAATLDPDNWVEIAKSFLLTR